jgi:hypothetical protein
MLKYSAKIWPFPSQREGDEMAIRYAVDLTDTERAALREIISKNKAKRSTIINVYILLKADRTCGWPNEDIASAYEVSTNKVEQLTTCPFCRRGALRIIATITQESVITRILRHLKLASVPPPIAPARSRQERFDWVA